MSPDPRRDCEHGRKKGKCIDCDFVEVETENDVLRATIATLTAERDEARCFVEGLEDKAEALAKRAESAEAALSVAAGANGALLLAVEQFNRMVPCHCSNGVVCDYCAVRDAALSAPLVADPRVEALASALAEIERWEQPGASWARELARAALAAWRAR